MNRTLHPARIVPLATVLLLGLSACGGGGTSSAGGSGQPSSQPSAQSSGQPSGQGAANAGAPGGRPGANGEIAAIAGKTMQVQSQQDGQVAVTYTATTTISQQVKASETALQVGDCVMVTSDPASSSGGSTVAAVSVRITPASGGSCAPAGFGGGGGQRPAGAPSGGAGGPGGGGPGGGGRFGGGAFGQVTAATAGGFTVKQTRPQSSGDATSTSVTTSSSTTWSTTAKATAGALKVGRCVAAQGSTDDTGAMTATSISVSDKVDGQCAAGMGRPGGAGLGS
jgi:hypothetical protein